MFLVILFFVASCASEQPCLDSQSIDISDVKSSKDGSIVKDGVTFPPKYVYTKNISNETRTFGCLCQTKDCFRKCCPYGQVFHQKNCTNMSDKDLLKNYGIGTFYMADFRKHVDVKENFDLLYGRPCEGMYLEDSPWYVQQDGKLYVKIDTSVKVLIYDASKYCIDTFVSDTEEPHLNALICFVPKPEHNNYTMSSSCMLISCFFILLTVAVYAWLPELRNLHGMVLMAYLLSFFVGFLFLATMQILILLKEISEDICIVLTFIIYFSLLAAFFWLNVMCYDIWWTFSGKRAHGRSGSQNKRFLCYAIYAFGVPTILTIVMAALEFSNIPLHPLLPKLRLQGCFLYGNSKLLYLYGPIVILCVANLIFFALTAFKIAKIKKETKMLRDKESSTHDQDRKDTQRFTLYVKLFTVMGINWILEVVSSFYPEADVFWQFSDAYNVLVGLIIFIIFVCKKKTWRMIKKRFVTLYNCLRRGNKGGGLL
ncbi:probable G-protein coupled receptor Mth-like 3 isoform X10 [Spodoptera litura]|uniref:Probable G-protein coupled receptor Mth-like 3 isoform X10 n=1 Tax=Spodoptera litura TaxID=69820 RepID=A0A9J7EM77_SPOLT|nr:probable G-protein coupled receptor Mth-like 3 isoform X10 [Spodoptera litura]